MLLEHLGKHFKEAKDTENAELFFSKSRDVKDRAQVIHDSVLRTENLSEDIQKRQRRKRLDRRTR
jgi:hypothetical protein